MRVYVPTTAFFIGTMSCHSGSLGLDLNLQQQLRWVNMKHESDSLQSQLMLHLRRSLADNVSLPKSLPIPSWQNCQTCLIPCSVMAMDSVISFLTLRGTSLVILSSPHFDFFPNFFL